MICLINKRAAKAALLIAFFILLIKTTSAQKPLVVYYFGNFGHLLPSVKGADYILAIYKPDSSGNKDLYIVKAYYPDGKLKFIGGTNHTDLNPLYPGSTDSFKIILQEGYIGFFPNGNKMKRGTYKDNLPVGEEANYYPNGKLYCTKTYTVDNNCMLNKCIDTAGKTICENGNGNWIIPVDQTFRNFTAGAVIDGIAVGKWLCKLNDSVTIETIYRKDSISNSCRIDKNGIKTYDHTDTLPQFEGGINAFFKYLSVNIRYPAAARENNDQGRVIISFVVAPDGNLTELKVIKGVSKSINDEAMRVMENSPKWRPGIVDGKPVRVAYSVPISFTLQTVNWR